MQVTYFAIIINFHLIKISVYLILMLKCTYMIKNKDSQPLMCNSHQNILILLSKPY